MATHLNFFRIIYLVGVLYRIEAKQIAPCPTDVVGSTYIGDSVNECLYYWCVKGQVWGEMSCPAGTATPPGLNNNNMPCVGRGRSKCPDGGISSSSSGYKATPAPVPAPHYVPDKYVTEERKVIASYPVRSPQYEPLVPTNLGVEHPQITSEEAISYLMNMAHYAAPVSTNYPVDAPKYAPVDAANYNMGQSLYASGLPQQEAQEGVPSLVEYQKQLLALIHSDSQPDEKYSAMNFNTKANPFKYTKQEMYLPDKNQILDPSSYPSDAAQTSFEQYQKEFLELMSSPYMVKQYGNDVYDIDPKELIKFHISFGSSGYPSSSSSYSSSASSSNYPSPSYSSSSDSYSSQSSYSSGNSYSSGGYPSNSYPAVASYPAPSYVTHTYPAPATTTTATTPSTTTPCPTLATTTPAMGTTIQIFPMTTGITPGTTAVTADTTTVTVPVTTGPTVPATTAPTTPGTTAATTASTTIGVTTAGTSTALPTTTTVPAVTTTVPVTTAGTTTNVATTTTAVATTTTAAATTTTTVAPTTTTVVTTTTAAGTTLFPLSALSNIGTVFPENQIQGGTLQTSLLDLDQCINGCNADTSCLSIDFDEAGQLANGMGSFCWFHTATTACNAMNTNVNVFHVQLTANCP